MTITKQEQITHRRQSVLDLSARRLTQQEIASELLVSQKTLSNDLMWLKKDAIEFVKKNREHIAFEYKQALSNFYQLRKEAWKHFHSTQNEGVKTHLYDVLESINNDIMDLLAAGDMIELELLENAREDAEEIREDMNKTLVQQTETLF